MRVGIKDTITIVIIIFGCNAVFTGSVYGNSQVINGFIVVIEFNHGYFSPVVVAVVGTLAFFIYLDRMFFVTFFKLKCSAYIA